MVYLPPNQQGPDKGDELSAWLKKARKQLQGTTGESRTKRVKELFNASKKSLNDEQRLLAWDALQKDITGEPRLKKSGVRTFAQDELNPKAILQPGSVFRSPKKNKDTKGMKNLAAFGGRGALSAVEGLANALAQQNQAAPAQTYFDMAMDAYRQGIWGGADQTEQLTEQAVGDILGYGAFAEEQLGKGAERSAAIHSGEAANQARIHAEQKALLAGMPAQAEATAKGVGGQGAPQYNAAVAAAQDFTAAAESSKAAASSYVNQMDAASQEYFNMLKGAVQVETAAQAGRARTAIGSAKAQADSDSWQRFMDVIGIGMKEDEMALSLAGAGEGSPGLFSGDYLETLAPEEQQALAGWVTDFSAWRSENEGTASSIGEMIDRYINEQIAEGSLTKDSAFTVRQAITKSTAK